MQFGAARLWMFRMLFAINSTFATLFPFQSLGKLQWLQHQIACPYFIVQSLGADHFRRQKQLVLSCVAHTGIQRLSPDAPGLRPIEQKCCLYGGCVACGSLLYAFDIQAFRILRSSREYGRSGRFWAACRVSIRSKRWWGNSSDIWQWPD